MGSLVVITTNEDPNTGFAESADASYGLADGGRGLGVLGREGGGHADLSFGAEPGQGLIPGIPDELALRCLAGVPYLSRVSLSLVCKAWRNCFRSAAVYNIRHKSQRLEEILCLSFLDKPPPSSSSASSSSSNSSSSPSSSSSSSSPSSACLSLKLLDRERWRWLPLASEYRHTKCKVKNFQCRAFQHKVFVFSNEEWAVLKEANWPNFGLPQGLGSSRDVPDVVPCNGDFYSLEGSSIWRLSTAAQVRPSISNPVQVWEPVTQLPPRHYKSGSFRQKYFLVALNGQLGLIDVWQDRWFWRQKVKANMSFLTLPSATESASALAAGPQALKWGPLHQPVATGGKDIAGFAVFYV